MYSESVPGKSATYAEIQWRRTFFLLFAKHITMWTNFIFLIFSFLLIFLGAYSFSRFQDYSDFLRETIPIGIIVLGIFLIFVAFFGCCGAFQENKKMLFIYFLLLLGLMISQITVGGVAYNMRNDIDDGLYEAWKSHPHEAAEIQDHWNCCGYSSTDDYPIDDCNANTTKQTGTTRDNSQNTTSSSGPIHLTSGAGGETTQAVITGITGSGSGSVHDLTSGSTGTTGTGVSTTGTTGTGASTTGTTGTGASTTGTTGTGVSTTGTTGTTGDGGVIISDELQPCKSKIVDYYRDNFNIVGGTAVVLGCLQLAGLVSSLILIRFIGKDEYRRMHEV